MKITRQVEGVGAQHGPEIRFENGLGALVGLT